MVKTRRQATKKKKKKKQIRIETAAQRMIQDRM
jgi:hypothetical protein